MDEEGGRQFDSKQELIFFSLGRLRWATTQTEAERDTWDIHKNKHTEE